MRHSLASSYPGPAYAIFMGKRKKNTCSAHVVLLKGRKLMVVARIVAMAAHGSHQDLCAR
jgi:hypothetical protein